LAVEIGGPQGSVERLSGEIEGVQGGVERPSDGRDQA
jgi:hypothetical protein